MAQLRHHQEKCILGNIKTIITAALIPVMLFLPLQLPTSASFHRYTLGQNLKFPRQPVRHYSQMCRYSLAKIIVNHTSLLMMP